MDAPIPPRSAGTNVRTPPPQRTRLVVSARARPQPFRDAEEAWMWTASRLAARRGSARATVRNFPGMNRPRPCAPDEVLKCLDTLYRRRRIDLVHARILRFWGERGVAPNPRREFEACDARLWSEALSRLEWPLRIKGIVA